MQTISIAVSAILIAAGLITAPSLINNARDVNAQGDLANIAMAQEFALADKGRYLAELRRGQPDSLASVTGVKYTLSVAEDKVTSLVCNTPDPAYLLKNISPSGKTFWRSSASPKTSTTVAGLGNLPACITSHPEYPTFTGLPAATVNGVSAVFSGTLGAFNFNSNAAPSAYRTQWFPWADNTGPGWSSNVTNVTATLDGTPIAISVPTGGWEAYGPATDGSPIYGTGFGVYANSDVVIGNGSPGTAYAFAQRGVITATIAGVPGNTAKASGSVVTVMDDHPDPNIELIHIADAGINPYDGNFPWVAQKLEQGASSFNVSSVTDVTATIDGVATSINSETWNVSYDRYAREFLILTSGDLIIGDGGTATFNAWLTNGTIKLTLDGVPGNTVSLKNLVLRQAGL